MRHLYFTAYLVNGIHRGRGLFTTDVKIDTREKLEVFEKEIKSAIEEQNEVLYNSLTLTSLDYQGKTDKYV